jgi:hypothetical protein
MGAEALVASLALTAIGTGLQVHGAMEGAEAAKESIAAQQRAERARQQGLEIEKNRQRRNDIRAGIIARSQALSSATSRGVEDSSILGGAYGQIAGQTAFNVAGANLQQGLGNELFAASRQGLAAQEHAASAGTIGAFGQGISSLGSAVGSRVGDIYRLGYTPPGGKSKFNQMFGSYS